MSSPQQQFAQPGQPPPMGVVMTPRIQDAIGQVDLLPGEQVVYAIQADGFYIGSAPILKLIAAMQAFFTTITGGHIRVFLVVSNQRVMVIKSIQFMCGCQRAKSVHAVALSGVKEAGSAKDTQLCCINTRVVHVQSLTQQWNLAVKKMSDAETRAFVTNLSAVIVAHSTRAGL